MKKRGSNIPLFLLTCLPGIIIIEHMIPKVYVLVGMIASGKSTYCQHAAKAGNIIVNDDAIVNLLHADDYTLYDKALKVMYKNVENSIIGLALCLGKSVVVDRGLNVSMESRKRFIALANSCDVSCNAIIFPKDEYSVHAKRRFDKDNRGLTYETWLDTAMHHANKYSVPTVYEGFHNVYTITYDEIIDGKVL